MDYKIKNPKILGDVIGLYSVAEAQAKRIGFASGKLNEPAYNAALQDWVRQIANDAKSGILITSNHRGIRTPVDALMSEFKAGNGGHFMSEDENLNITTCCYALLYDLNAWASSRGDQYTVTHDGWWIDESGIIDPTRQALAGLPAPDGVADESVPVPNSKAPDLTKLATREQLIAAFGSFTGMNMGWFNNQKDTPTLFAACKVTGQGGRGRIAEPLFCPYAVMLWLIDPKRRKGGKLGAEKAWQLLEDHFPVVYAVHSVGDPRQPD